jgi:hypothetical protein
MAELITYAVLIMVFVGLSPAKTLVKIVVEFISTFISTLFSKENAKEASAGIEKLMRWSVDQITED